MPRMGMAVCGLMLAGMLLAGCARQGGGLAAGGGTTPGSLIGATPQAVEASLGRPWLRRSEGGAEVWLYRSGVCSLDVFLFRDRHGAAGGGPRVSQAAPMPRSVPTATCMASLERRTAS